MRCCHNEPHSRRSQVRNFAFESNPRLRCCVTPGATTLRCCFSARKPEIQIEWRCGRPPAGPETASLRLFDFRCWSCRICDFIVYTSHHRRSPRPSCHTSCWRIKTSSTSIHQRCSSLYCHPSAAGGHHKHDFINPSVLLAATSLHTIMHSLLCPICRDNSCWIRADIEMIFTIQWEYLMRIIRI